MDPSSWPRTLGLCSSWPLDPLVPRQLWHKHTQRMVQSRWSPALCTHTLRSLHMHRWRVALGLGGPTWISGTQVSVHTHMPTHRIKSLTQAESSEKAGPAHQAQGTARHTDQPAPHMLLAPFIPSLLCFPTLVPPQTTRAPPFPPLNIPQCVVRPQRASPLRPIVRPKRL